MNCKRVPSIRITNLYELYHELQARTHVPVESIIQLKLLTDNISHNHWGRFFHQRHTPAKNPIDIHKVALEKKNYVFYD